MIERMFVCDFCSAPDPTWSYPSKDFIFRTGPIDQGSKGAWAACDECQAIIERRDRAALAARSLVAFRRTQEIREQDSVEILHMLSALHEAFWRERYGPARRL